MSDPGLSIAVAARGACDADAFIQALRRLDMLDTDQISIHIAADDEASFAGKQLAANVQLQLYQPGTSILHLWGLALADCTQDYVAALDIKCPPAEGWLQAAQQAMRNDVALFFGPVNCRWRHDDKRIVGYLAEYAQFHSPLQDSLDEVPGNNIVCRRALLDDADTLRSKGFYKTFMIWRLQQQHVQPQAVPSMVVEYAKPFATGHYLHRRYQHGRCFGATRHDNAGQPSRALCALFTPLLPWLRCWRIYRAICAQPQLKRAGLRFAPILFGSECAWSLGELAGYVAGGRQYCKHLD